MKNSNDVIVCCRRSWIAAREWELREVFQKLTAQAFERILKGKMSAAAVKPAV